MLRDVRMKKSAAAEMYGCDNIWYSPPLILFFSSLSLPLLHFRQLCRRSERMSEWVQERRAGRKSRKEKGSLKEMDQFDERDVIEIEWIHTSLELKIKPWQYI